MVDKHTEDNTGISSLLVFQVHSADAKMQHLPHDDDNDWFLSWSSET